MSGAISSLITETADLMKALGVKEAVYTGGTLPARSAISGEILARVPEQDAKVANEAVATSQTAFKAWRNVPAPKRGELIRLLGPTKPNSAAWFRSKSARSCPKASAKCRR